MEGVKVQSITLMLEGEAAEWKVTLHDDPPELCNFDCFVGAYQRGLRTPWLIERLE